MLHTKLHGNQPAGSGEEDFCRVFTIYGHGGHLDDLDLQYSHTFITSMSCLHLPIFRSLAAILSEKSTVFTFSHRKA